MNFVDLVVVIVVVAAIMSGVRAGLVGMLAGAIGTLGGLLLGGAIAPQISDALEVRGNGRVLLMSAVIVVSVAVLSYLTQLGAMTVAASLRALQLGWVDRAAGGAIAFGLAVALAWLVGGVLAVGPSQGVARAVQESALLRAIDQRLPAAPGVVADIQQALIDHGMPLPFNGFEPQLEPVDPPSSETVAAAQAAAQASTVRVASLGCGGGSTGSGAVVAPELVFTNAHVVAGGEHVEIDAVDGSHDATVVWFDPEMDIAVLRVPGLDVPVLPIASGTVAEGAGAAVLGYPNGGPLVVAAAAVLDQRTAVGRDIWGGGAANREVYVLQAVVRPGDSGGPFVAADGTVLGLVFARSNVHSDVGYALTSSELQPVLAATSGATAQVATGRCVD